MRNSAAGAVSGLTASFYEGCSPWTSRYNPLAMANFKADEVNDKQRDWIILRDGGVHLYWRREILADDLTGSSRTDTESFPLMLLSGSLRATGNLRTSCMRR